MDEKSPANADTTKTAWTFTDGSIRLKARDMFYLGLVNEKLLLRKASTGCATKWEVEAVEPKVYTGTLVKTFKGFFRRTILTINHASSLHQTASQSAILQLE